MEFGIMNMPTQSKPNAFATYDQTTGATKGVIGLEASLDFISRFLEADSSAYRSNAASDSSKVHAAVIESDGLLLGSSDADFLVSKTTNAELLYTRPYATRISNSQLATAFTMLAKTSTNFSTFGNFWRGEEGHFLVICSYVAKAFGFDWVGMFIIPNSIYYEDLELSTDGTFSCICCAFALCVCLHVCWLWYFLVCLCVL